MRKPLRVLIVEDSADDAELIARVLRAGGYDPTWDRVETAEAMRSALETRSWDVVIADHSLPHFDAFGALEVLHDSGLDLPFLVVSGVIGRLVGEEIAVAAMKAGAHDYVLKDNLTRLPTAVERELRDAEVRARRRQAEEELRRLNAELEQRVAERTAQLEATYHELREEAAERKRLLAYCDATFSSMAGGIIVYDENGAVVRLNAATEKMFGVSLAEYQRPIAGRLKLLGWETPDGKQITPEESPVFRALAGGVVRDELLVVHPPNRDTLWVSVNAAPIQIEEGKMLGVVLNFVDVTRLHELQFLQEDLLHTVSHDLRAPLAIILGQAQFLERAVAKQQPGRVTERSVQAILNGARRMNTIIEDLLNAARLESGQYSLNLAPVNERQFVLDLLGQMAKARIAGIERVSMEAPADLPSVVADPDRLERILSNLLSNALKYSYPGTPIVVRLASSDGEVVTSVTDQGPGISSEEMPRLFERFYRTQTGRQRAESLGLGLYIARKLVEAQGGRIWVESRVGQGSTFSFSVPAAPS